MPRLNSWLKNTSLTSSSVTIILNLNCTNKDLTCPWKGMCLKEVFLKTLLGQVFWNRLVMKRPNKKNKSRRETTRRKKRHHPHLGLAPYRRSQKRRSLKSILRGMTQMKMLQKKRNVNLVEIDLTEERESIEINESSALSKAMIFKLTLVWLLRNK